MIHKMPGQLHSLRPRKRKSGSRKVSTLRRRCVKSPKTQSAAESRAVDSAVDSALDSAVDSDYSTAYSPLERLSLISCECHKSAGRRRCSASPQLDRQGGKENELRTGQLDPDSCRVNGVWDKRESNDMDCEESSRIFFPDDDSNQILPVEQFFGNLDVVQDYPQSSSATSGRVERKDRRRHYYAPEDSDEEAGLGGLQRDERGDT